MLPCKEDGGTDRILLRDNFVPLIAPSQKAPTPGALSVSAVTAIETKNVRVALELIPFRGVKNFQATPINQGLGTS